MYYTRKIDTFLTEWKNDPDHLPLIVKGARQIGKTESILHFASNNYENVVYINFALQKMFLKITADGYDTGSVIKNITLVDPKLSFVAHKTLIIFDEIQEYPDIATTLKSFKLDGKYDVICSGSMLGINYKTINSNSVGYKTDYEMRSFDFEEFLLAKGYSQTQIDSLLLHMQKLEPFTENEFEVFRELFLDFSVLGGMPAVIKAYLESNNFSKALQIQKQLILDYEEDVKKYSTGVEQKKILEVYRSIPAQLAKEFKKFQYTKISTKARSKDYFGCVEWLKDAGVINKCDCLNFPELPLKGNVDNNKFKLYFADTGLLVASLDEEASDDLRENKNLGVYKGALFENLVADALVKQGFGLYYFKKDNSTLEEDFFVRTRDELIPVKVKSENNMSRSLKSLIQSDHYPMIKQGIKFGNCNIGKSNDIISFPYFVCCMLKRYLKTLAS